MSLAVRARKGESAGPSKTMVPPKAVASGLRVTEPARGRETDHRADGIPTSPAPRLDWSLAKMSIDKKSIDPPSQPRKADRGLISVGQAAANLRQAQDRRVAEIRSHGPVRFRVPTTSDMKVLFDMGNVPEDVLKNRVQLALTRMAEEKKLKSTDPVPELMKKIFPEPGLFDEAEYEKAVDVTDRKKIYQSVLDARAKVTSADKPKLKAVMADSIALIGKCAANAVNLKSVFGSRHAVAKDVYVMAKVALTTAMNHMDTQIDTDYNLDDPETGLGGWATFFNQHIHLKGSVAKVTDENDAKITIIHESCHLANDSVGDEGGYYGQAGFEAAKEAVKVTNAAHYEEIPRRLLADKDPTLSKYKDPATGNYLDFKPGASAAGAPLNFEQRVKGRSNDYLRKAWDKAGDVRDFIRDIRTEELAGKTAGFKAHKARVLEISRLMRLTVHEQPDATASINQMDVVLAEGVARAAAKAYKNGREATVPDPLALKMPQPEPFFKARRSSVMEQKLELKPMPELGPPIGAPVLITEDVAADKVIDDSIKAAGTITGNFADDRKLMDWLVAEYKKDI
jgi:hypothetical protein